MAQWTLVSLLLQIGLFAERLASAQPVEVLQETARALKKEQDQFERWCNGTLVAQHGRGMALQQLLAQAQSGYENSYQLEELRSDVLGANAAVEKAHVAMEAHTMQRHQQLMAAQFQKEDASRDVEVLSRVQKKFKGGVASDTIASLLEHAKGVVQKFQTQAQLLQSPSGAADEAGEADRLESDRKSKEDSIGQVQLQVFTSERSLDVLTAAVEDQSAYFADLQTVCSISQHAYQRMETKSLASLRQALKSMSSRRGDAVIQKWSHRKKAVHKTLAAALQALPVAPAVVATSPTTAKPAVVTEAPTVAAQQQTSAAPVVSEASTVAPTLAPTAAAKQQTSPAPTQAVASEVVPAAAAKSASAAQLGKVQHISAKGRHRAHKHHKHAKVEVAAAHKHVSRHATAAAKQQSVSMVQDTSAAAEARTIEAPAAATAAAAAATPEQDSDAAAEARATQALSMPSPQAQEEISVRPRKKALKSITSVTTAPADPEQDSPQVQPLAAEKQDQADVAMPKPKPNGKASFIQGIYSSAAGNMPSEYAAWTPDGSADETEHKPKLNSMKGSSATSSMSAMLGGDDDSDSQALAAIAPTTAMPAPATVSPSTTNLPAEAPPAQPVAAATAEANSVMDLSAHIDEKVDSDKNEVLHGKGSQSDDGPQKPQLIEAEAAAPAKQDTRKALAKADSYAGARVDEVKSDAQELKSDAQAEAKTEDEMKSVSQQAEDTVKGSHVHLAKHSSTDSDSEVAVNASPRAAATASNDEASKDDDDSDDLSTDDSQSSPPPPPAVIHRPPPVGGDGMMNELNKASVEGTSARSPEPKNLPTQYAAWNPDDATEAAKKKEAVLAQMEADFDDDGTATTMAATRPPPRRKHRRHHKITPAPAVSKHDDDSQVVYDDDDLPKHHPKPIMAELSGGWRSLMHTQKAKSHKAKLDPDIAVMQSLYTSDGGLPTQYTAWTPGASEPAAEAAPMEDPTALFQISSIDEWSQFASAAASDANDDNAQIEQLILSVAGTMPNDGGSPRAFAPSAFLEQSAVRSDAQRVSAARVVLQEYAEALQSDALRKLAHATPNVGKLKSLWKRLSAVDPLTHPKAITTSKKQAQAEQWCAYFQESKPTLPVHQALAELQKAKASLANMTAQRAAVSEEADARVQLQRTVEQDTQILTSVMTILRQSTTDSLDEWARNFTSQLSNSGAKGLLGLGEAVEGIREGHVELADALEATLRGRSSALQVHKQKLKSLQDAAAAKDHMIVQLKTRAKAAQAKVDSIRKKFANIGRSCDSTLRTLEHRRHAGHMEAHAVEMALKVLGSSS